MPRRADGTWVDANGNVVYRTDPNDTGVDRTKATYKDGFWVDNATGQRIPNKNDLPQRQWVSDDPTSGSPRVWSEEKQTYVSATTGEPMTGAGHWANTWPDGTPVTPEETAEINAQAGGAPPSAGAPNYGVTGFADPSGVSNNFLPANAPGAELPTAQADADRQRMADYLAQLQGQAATGSGAWEQQLAKATQQGTASATALGQSAAGVDSLAAQRNISNAKAGVEQRAAGQAETLRAQTQQQAQEQLAQIYAAQGSLDAQQAAEQAAARQGRREANQALTDKANQVNQSIYSGVGQGFASLLSKGGQVPGKAQVFGDDEANDTVPAMLSPGEIVLPRSVTHSSDPEGAAAAFVQAVKEHHGSHNFAIGGPVAGQKQIGFSPQGDWKPVLPPNQPGEQPWETKPDTNAPDALPVLANDPTVTQAGNAPFLGIGTPQQAASVRNGGLLDTTAYNASRDATLGATRAFLDAYAGRGPSVAPQQLRSATDANIAEALAAQASTRGAGRGAAAGLISGKAAEVGSEHGGKTAAMAAEEATRGGQSYAAAIQRQRQMDLAFALAQQQAAWRNSMLNAGIGVAAQAQMRGILGGVGQAFASGASALGNLDWPGDSGDSSTGNDAWDVDLSPGSEQGDWGGSDGWGDSGGDLPSWASDSGTAYAAHGGEIRRRGYADGGEVDSLDAGTELAVPRDAGALQAPPFAPAVRPPGPLPVAAPLAPPPAGLPMAQPRPQAQTQMQAAPAEPSAFELEKQAEEQKTSALEELGRAQAEILVGQQKVLDRAAIDRQEAQARARMTADADMARILEARQAVSSISDTVDPGRWWASRSTPGKIAAAIGLALGAIGAGNDGVNRAVGIIENAIGRDLEAQKAEHQIRMRKGQMAVDSATSIYALHRQLAQDDIGATDAAKATAMELAKNQIEIATARASSPLAKAQGQALLAQLIQKRDAFDAATKQRAFDNYLKREDTETRRIAALKESASQVGRDFVAPGYKLQPGAAPKAEELGKWRDALAEKRNTDVATQKLKALIDKSSFVPGSSESAQAQSLISDLKISYKNMAALGALSGEDYALVEASIPDPTSFRGHFTPDKTLKSRLDQFAKTAENKLNNKASVLGIVKDEGGASGGGDVAGAKAWLEANPTSPKAEAVRAKLRQMGAL